MSKNRKPKFKKSKQMLNEIIDLEPKEIFPEDESREMITSLLVIFFDKLINKISKETSTKQLIRNLFIELLESPDSLLNLTNDQIVDKHVDKFIANNLEKSKQ